MFLATTVFLMALWQSRASTLTFCLWSLMAQTVKNWPAMRDTSVGSLVRKIPWRREWLSTPVFLPRESHGQRSLAGYSPWAHKESGRTEAAQHTCMYIYTHYIFCVFLIDMWRHFLYHLQGQCISVQFSSGAQLCPTLCDPMNRSMPGLNCPSQTPGVHSDSCPSSR